MKKIMKRLYPIIAGLIVAASIFIPTVNASQPRDYDTNAIIYGGAYSVTELRNIYNNGNTRNNCRETYSCPYQYHEDFDVLYGRLGMGPEYWDNLKDATIFKDGHVEVDGRTVATGVQTMGRHYLPGSTREPLITYTDVYWRSPSVSFNSNSIPAFAYLNYDGSMAFGIIKSCGNPIKAVGHRTQPKYNLTIRKYEDLDGDKQRDANESWLAGWTFNVNGNGVNQNVTTGADGSVTVTGLVNGSYVVRESLQPGWTNTTNIAMTAVINGRNGEIWFGNRKIPAPTYALTVYKWNDQNGNQVVDMGEKFLQNWKFTVKGNNINQEITTDANGKAVLGNLAAGSYTVSEIQQEGWTNTTPLTRTVNVTSNQTVYFGNRRIPTYTLTVIKYNDVNGNQRIDAGEKLLPGWTFKVKSNNIDRNITTDANGSATLSNLTAGTYTVTEQQQNGWTNTTPLTRTIDITRVQRVEFGNRRTVTPSDTFTIRARKYEDLNGNAKHDDNEPWLEGWKIKLSGGNLDREFVTNGEGSVAFSNLPAGIYTISEEMQNGWKNTTAISQRVTVPDPVTLEGYAEFGNQKLSTPVTPSGEVTPTPTVTENLPTSGPEEAVFGSLGTVSLAGIGLYFRKGKKLLKAASKKF